MMMKILTSMSLIYLLWPNHAISVHVCMVYGIKNYNTRKWLLRQPKLDLPKCIEICRSDETLESQMKTVDHLPEENIHELSTNKRSDKSQRALQRRDGNANLKHTKKC